MASANNANTNTNNAGGGGGGSGAVVNNIRGVGNVLQQHQQQQLVDLNGPDAWSYDRIIEMMQKLDLQDDGIIMNCKISNIEDNFCNIVRDEKMLCEFMQYINDKALEDPETALKFALLFSSRSFDALAMNDTKVRCIMLKILETNYMKADVYRHEDKERLYNSITLLGEYYHRVRLADNSPIAILGESLLALLTREISDTEVIDVKRAKLILSQITLNGDIMRVRHKEDLTNLFFHIRRNLIEQPALTPVVKALLLMTLDLYYSNFANLGVKLEEMYTKYLVQDDEGNNNNNNNNSDGRSQTCHQTIESPKNYRSHGPKYQPQQQQQQYCGNQSPITDSTTTTTYSITTDSGNNVSFTNTTSSNYEQTGDDLAPSESEPPAVLTKKWSEQVCEESFLENDYYGDYNGEPSQSLNTSGETAADRLNSSTDGVRASDDNERENRNTRRSHKPRSSPRPLKQQTTAAAASSEGTQKSEGEERDQTKPLPRWRAPRFNRESGPSANQRHSQHFDADQQPPQQHRHRNAGGHRRFSINLDDDEQSVRSEGGSIRLYSINDRLKHSQEKIERSIGNNYSAIANSNWDRQSQHDDRSERSYISNYERGAYRRGGRQYHNRPTYDKPPRFQKNNQNKDNKIHSDSWRRSYGHNNDGAPNSYNDDNMSHRSNGSSRASTLPRPRKGNMEGGFNRRSQSPFQRQQQQQHHHNQNQQRPRHHPNNGRYSSHSSLASETSSNFERRQDQRNRNYGRHEDNWDKGGSKPNVSEQDTPKDGNSSELVRNARQTTKYMNYLSSKK